MCLFMLLVRFAGVDDFVVLMRVFDHCVKPDVCYCCFTCLLTNHYFIIVQLIIIFFQIMRKHNKDLCKMNCVTADWIPGK